MYDESKHTQVCGTGVVTTGGAGSTATLDWLPERSNAVFRPVPAGRKLVITDFVLLPQGDVTARHTINIAERTAGGSRILLQLVVNAGAHTQAHFHTGFVIAPGSTVQAWSDANGAAGKHVSLTLNGYVAALGNVPLTAGAAVVDTTVAQAVAKAVIKKVAKKAAKKPVV